MPRTAALPSVEGSGVSLALHEWGDASTGPTVVLVHGYPDCQDVWSLVAADLAADHHVVTYDVRGAGASSAPEPTAAYRFEHLVADLGAVIDAVSPGRPVHLVGHDWGSIQGWEAVTCGTLDGRIATFTSISGPSLDHIGGWVRAHLTPRGVPAALRQALKSYYVYLFQVPYLAPAFWRLGGARLFGPALHRIDGTPVGDGWPGATITDDAARGVRLYRANVPGRLRRPQPRHTRIPVQVVVPSGDRFVSPALLDGIEAIAPNLRRRDVEGTHWIVRSHPERVARWVREHVAAADTGAEVSSG